MKTNLIKRRRIELSLLLLVMMAAVLILGCSSEEKQAKDQEPPIEGRPVDRPTLRSKLEARKAQFMETAPPEMVAIFDRGVEQVAESGVLATALKVGDTAPAFALPNAQEQEVSLNELLDEGPVVIAWYRGGWCPYCNLELVALREALPEIDAAGGQLIAISPEIPDSAVSTQARDSLPFEVLSDVGNDVAREFGIVYTLPEELAQQFEGRLDLAAYNGDNSGELPLAVTYIIDTDGIIRYAFVDPDYRKRAEPSVVVAELKKLTEHD
jgi:peroxiredoxin